MRVAKVLTPKGIPHEDSYNLIRQGFTHDIWLRFCERRGVLVLGGITHRNGVPVYLARGTAAEALPAPRFARQMLMTAGSSERAITAAIT